MVFFDALLLLFLFSFCFVCTETANAVLWHVPVALRAGIGDLVRKTLFAALRVGAGLKKATGINPGCESLGEKYRETTPLPRIVADYVSGMTDDYLMNAYKEIVMPKSFGVSFGAK